MDLRTLVLANFVLMVFDGIALWAFGRAYPDAKGIRGFTRCAFSMAAGAAMIGVADARAHGALLALGNGLLVLGFVFLNQGVAAFWSRPQPRRWLHYGVVAVTAAVYFHFTGAGDELGPRAVIAGTALAFELAVGADIFWRARAAEAEIEGNATGGTRPAALVMGAFAAFNLARGPLTWIEQSHPRRELWVLVATDYGFLLCAALLGLALVWMIIVDLRARLGQLVRIDDLTGLLNRRALDAMGEEMLAQVRARAAALALLVMDLDHFKQLNDRFGHPAGDAALLAVAEHLRREMRAGDVAARLGGEEFVLLLPEVGLEGAWELAERLRGGVASLALVHRDGAAAPRPVPLTASFGLAVLEDPAETWTSLLHRADQALYQAKQDGRNCVRAAAPGVAASAP